MQNPYETLADGFIKNVIAGNRGTIGGEPMGLPDRLREYAYYRQENATEASDALLVNDLLTAARELSRLGIM